MGRTRSAGRPLAGRWTPSIAAAIATSRRSLTSTRVVGAGRKIAYLADQIRIVRGRAGLSRGPGSCRRRSSNSDVQPKPDHVALAPVGDVIANHSAVVRLTILRDFQKRRPVQKDPRTQSTTPSPETAPRTKLLRAERRDENEYVNRTLFSQSVDHGTKIRKRPISKQKRMKATARRTIHEEF